MKSTPSNNGQHLDIERPGNIKQSEICTTVRQRIKEQIYSERLPPEKTLAEEFQVNVKTVAKALQTLAREGVVERSRGRGTFVRRNMGAQATSLYMYPLGRDVFFPTNPFRYRVTAFMNALWWAASKRQLMISLLPRCIDDGDEPLAPGNGTAVVIFGDSPPARIEALLATGYRPIMVAQDREYHSRFRHLPFRAIDSKIEYAHDLLVRYFIKHERRQIAMIYDDNPRWKDKYALLSDLLFRYGLEFSPDRLVVSPNSAKYEGAVEELLARDVPFDALLTPHNELASHAAHVLANKGMRVPEDVLIGAIIGDVGGPSYQNHSFPYVDWDFDAVAEEVLDIITQGPYEPGTTYIPGALVMGRGNS